MLVLVQVLGGIFYLLNKAFLSLTERSENNHENRKWGWRTWSWIMFLIGLPFWLIVFFLGKNWIAFAIEAGGAPAMILGLLISVKGKGKEPRWLHYVAILGIVLGLGYSLYDFGGITALTQIIELALVTGFLIGTYELALKKSSGYLWFLLMHIACAILMYFENYPWLALQQVISIGFVLDAYRINKKMKSNF